ncbi:MAG: hypothetical protein F6J97_03065 [Leptolyngbya sp. SIO4C1]|nr:hypothetical protein [Leptolyngbya sp. SIO4C1]
MPAALLAALPAQAVSFRFVYGPNTPLEQMIGFEIAGNIWSSYLKNEVTLNIYVETTSTLPDGVVGGALPGIEAEYNYKDLVNAFQDSVASQADASAYGSLPIKNFAFEFRSNSKNALIKKVKKINFTRANAKALGIIESGRNKNDKKDKKVEKLDGVILMSDLSNMSLSWNYALTGSLSARQLDFGAVALHELGHTLGFISGVDDPGFISMVIEQQAKRKAIKGDKMKFSTILDLFRYSPSSAANGIPDLTFSREEKYFSVDGGKTNLGAFSLGAELEDFQASHWRDQSDTLGMMAPLLRPGQREQITNLDLIAFDVLGWTVGPAADSLNSAQLEQQARSRLAQSLGVSPDWLTANAIAAATRLQENRDKQIEKMIKDSKRYDRRRSSRTRYLQESWRSIYAQEAYLSSVTLSEPAVAEPVPEPGTTAAWISVGLLGLGIKQGRGRIKLSA